MKIQVCIREKGKPLPPLPETRSYFLFGISGHGKSYTLEEIFMMKNTSTTPFKITEVYNNKSKVLYEGAMNSPLEKMKAFKKAQLRKHVKATTRNTQSSRSCMIYSFGDKRYTFIDPMGSELPQYRDREGIIANQSLLSLEKCLIQLRNGDKPTFRDSILTLLLKEVLLGTCTFVVCIDPEDEASKRTLNFCKVISGIDYEIIPESPRDSSRESPREIEEEEEVLPQSREELRAVLRELLRSLR